MSHGTCGYDSSSAFSCMSYSMCPVNTHIRTYLIHLPLNCPVDPLLFLRNQTLILRPVSSLTDLGSSLTSMSVVLVCMQPKIISQNSIIGLSHSLHSGGGIGLYISYILRTDLISARYGELHFLELLVALGASSPGCWPHTPTDAV